MDAGRARFTRLGTPSNQVQPLGTAEQKKKDTTYVVSFFLVREAGVEPARPCEHWHLKPASLPIPPLAHPILFAPFRSAQDVYYHRLRRLSTVFFKKFQIQV